VVRPFLFLCSFLPLVALGDYAWIPKAETLVLKAGWEFLKSDYNFDASGTKRELTTNSAPTKLSQNQLFLDAEYGLTEFWSGILHTSFLSAQISGIGSTPSPLSGSGVFDTFLGLKWQVRSEKPVLALESGLVLPPYSTKNLASDELAVGDGTAGVLVRIHGGTRVKRFAFSLSPGLLFRFGRFSNQVLLDAAVSVTIRKVYFRLFESSSFSMTKDSNGVFTAENREPGSGGSYSRLATQPDLVSLGFKAGFFFSPKFRLEVSAAQTVWGNSAADGLRLSLALISFFDFHKPDEREPISEVPLNTD